MSEAIPEPTDDSVADGTQLPLDVPGEGMPEEEGDAGVNDTGHEPWYQEDEG